MLAGISASVTFDARIFFKVVLFKTLPKIPACMDFALLSVESFVISSTFSKLMSLISAPDTTAKIVEPTPLIFFTVCPSPFSFPVNGTFSVPTCIAARFFPVKSRSSTRIKFSAGYWSR